MVCIYLDLRTALLAYHGSEDQTNLYRHAKHNAEEAIALAKERAAQFDVQAALDRKTNEALKLAKGQANVREETEESPGSPKGPLMDRE